MNFILNIILKTNIELRSSRGVVLLEYSKISLEFGDIVCYSVVVFKLAKFDVGDKLLVAISEDLVDSFL